VASFNGLSRNSLQQTEQEEEEEEEEEEKDSWYSAKFRTGHLSNKTSEP
jgi:hypothetical protein